MPNGYKKRCDSASKKARLGGSSKRSRRKKPNEASTGRKGHGSGRHFKQSIRRYGFSLWNDEYPEAEAEALLVDENLDKKDIVSHPTGVTRTSLAACQICFDASRSTVDLAGCGHFACPNCLVQQYTVHALRDVSKYTATKRGASLVCFGHSCNRPVTGEQLRREKILLKTEDINNFYRFRTLSAARRKGQDVQDCKRCGAALKVPKPPANGPALAEAVVHGIPVNCRSCSHRTVATIIRPRTLDDRTEDLIRELQAWKGEKDEMWKRCPQCRELISKNGGCPHMICICGHDFWWTDIKSFSRNDKKELQLSGKF